MENEKYIKLWANNSKDSGRLIGSLEKIGYNVNHILTAADKPVLKNGDSWITGLGNILCNYNLGKEF